jgi:hypothetical protein
MNSLSLKNLDCLDRVPLATKNSMYPTQRLNSDDAENPVSFFFFAACGKISVDDHSICGESSGPFKVKRESRY